MANQIVWCDIPVSDLDRAVRFYSAVLGQAVLKHEFPGMTAGQLARALHVDPGTLSASVRRLEARGLVERRRDPVDTRRVTLGLTRQGRALDVPAGGTVEAAADELLATASPKDVAATVRVLERFADILTAPG